MKIEWVEKYMLEAERMITSGEAEQGLQLLNALLYDEPGYAGLHNHLGWAYLYYEVDYEKAERHFMVATKFHPEFAPSYLHLGTLFTRQARYDEAIRFLELGLKAASPNKFALYENLGAAYELKRDYKKAIKMYREAAASTAGHEGHNVSEGIKRCRKKQWVMMFTF